MPIPAAALFILKPANVVAELLILEAEKVEEYLNIHISKTVDFKGEI